MGGWRTFPTLKYVLWSPKNFFQCSTPYHKLPMTTVIRPIQREPTLSSWSDNPRKSCVRCVAKHPVPKDLAASIPALHSPKGQMPRKKTARRNLHAVVWTPRTVSSSVTRDVIHFPVNLHVSHLFDEQGQWDDKVEILPQCIWACLRPSRQRWRGRTPKIGGRCLAM